MGASELVTADELYRMGSEARFELIDGELMAYPFHGGMYGAAVARIAVEVGSFVRANGFWTVYLGQVGHVLRREPDTVLAPDLSYIQAERETDEGDGFLTVAPDLVIEVVESYESRTWIERKVRIYLMAGVEQVWIVDPIERGVWVHRSGEPVGVYVGSDVFWGGEGLPGFALRVDDLFE